jgi:ABC-type Mn2+/Zn2+ transport system ATPase subunit
VEDVAAPLLTVENADFGYEGRAVVRGASLVVRPAEFVVVLGANGSGKSTLLRGMLGRLPPLAGRVARRDGLRIGSVPQRETLDPHYPLSGRDVVMLGATRDLRPWQVARRAERRRARDALVSCEALDFAKQRFATLSGGQRQRILLARALATQPDWLVLDEPTAGVDPSAEHAILDLLVKLAREHQHSIWMVTHHVGAVAKRCDRRIRVEDGRVTEDDLA